MIQRIQSVWLLLVALLGISSIIAGSSGLLATNIIVVIFSALSIIISAYTIFKYKDRKHQMMMCNLLVIINVIVTLAFSFAMRNSGELDLNNLQAKYIILLLPVFSVVFSNLAKNGIKKDEELIRSADRLR